VVSSIKRDSTWSPGRPCENFLYAFQGGPPGRSRRQCRVVKPFCLEVNNVAAICGLRSGAVGGGRSDRTRQGVPAAAGFGEEAEAGPLSELGEQVPGLYAEPAREFAAGPVLAGLAGHDAGDLVSSAARAGRAGTGRLVRAAGARGGTVRGRDPDGDLHPGDRHGLAGTVLKGHELVRDEKVTGTG